MELLSEFVSRPNILAQACVCFVAVIVWRRYLSPLADIPGPALASVSRLWHLLQIVRGDQNLQLVELHEKLGPFVRIAPNEISVSHPEGIKKILLAPLHKGGWYKLLSIPDYRFQSPMSTTDPRLKAQKSKHFAPAYSLTNVIQNEAVVDRVIELLLTWLDKYADSREPMALDEFLSFTTFDISGELLFSKQYGFLKEGRDVGSAIANGAALNLYASTMGFFRWVHVLLVGNPLMSKLNILPMGHVYNTTVRALDERRHTQDNRFDFISFWLRALERKPDQLTMRDVYATTTSVVGAASDTVSAGLQSFVYYMIRHPDAWERVRDEIDEAQKREDPCSGRVLPFSFAQKLPFFQACVKESLRVLGPVAMGLPRLAPKGGITIGTRHFPEGTTLSISPWVMHLSKDFWGPDAREFNPDRWLREDSSTLEAYFMPWGAGYNSCPGQNIARIELSKIAATLVRDYNIRQVDPAQSWSWKAYFVLVPHSWPCYIEKRETKA